jgi:hypothetical protein
MTVLLVQVPSVADDTTTDAEHEAPVTPPHVQLVHVRPSFTPP